MFPKQFKFRKGEFEREKNAKYYQNVLNFIVKVIFDWSTFQHIWLWVPYDSKRSVVISILSYSLSVTSLQPIIYLHLLFQINAIKDLHAIIVFLSETVETITGIYIESE